MSWTQEELEELYQKINKALAEDHAFREKARKDARAAAEELAGRPLEEGFRLDYIEQDAGYGDTYVLPDFVGEELDPRELGAIAGGKTRNPSAAETVRRILPTAPRRSRLSPPVPLLSLPVQSTSAPRKAGAKAIAGPMPASRRPLPPVLLTAARALLTFPPPTAA